MWSKIIDPRISRISRRWLLRTFEYWMQASLNRGLLLCARAAVHSVVVTNVKATGRAAGEEGSGVVDVTTDV